MKEKKGESEKGRKGGRKEGRGKGTNGRMTF
jgi:hypothetical protein